ncbi:hypothetical protein Vi05172_g2416 [Venturia inaequalis]|nr:hypothetical protein Vi05172_g2416 [Venturia inaequalis]
MAPFCSQAEPQPGNYDPTGYLWITAAYLKWSHGTRVHKLDVFRGIEDHGVSSPSTVTEWIKKIGFAIIEVGKSALDWNRIHSA